MIRTDSRHGPRIAAGLAAGGSAVLLVVASFLPWIQTPMPSGGSTSISGWGSIHGGNGLVDGGNLNDLMSGLGSYLPGVAALVIGVLAIIPALIVAAAGPGVRPNRIAGGLLALCGAAALIWGLARAFSPGDAIGVLPDGQGSAGAGPWLTAVGGLVLLAAGGAVLAALLDPPPPVGISRGRKGLRG